MESFNIMFVGEVQKHPALYDYTHPAYSRNDLSQKAWTEVSDAVSLSVVECKEKWKNIRTTFVRKLRSLSTGTSKYRKPYYLHEAMQFTIPFLKTVSLPAPDEDAEVCHSWESLASDMLPKLESPEAPEEPDSPSQLPPSPSSPQIDQEHAEQGLSTEVTYPPSSMPLLTRAQDETGKQELPISNRTESTSKKYSTHKRKTEDCNIPEEAIAEYFAFKKAKTMGHDAELATGDKREISVRQFLNSQVLDLMSMTDAQLRLYKRRSLILIDEILGTNLPT